MKIFTKSLLFLFCIFLFSCGSTPKVVEETVDGVENDVTTDLNEDVIIIDEIVQDSDDEEYLRSVNTLETSDVVTKSEFEEDKAAILAIIEELADVMEEEDFNSWLDYISKDSISYYSSPKNIRKAQKKLPDKTLQLYGIKDYFKHVFIPARKNRRVDEIRYISKSYVKAVHVKNDKSIVVYYYFVKENGNWFVHIPEL